MKYINRESFDLWPFIYFVNKGLTNWYCGLEKLWTNSDRLIAPISKHQFENLRASGRYINWYARSDIVLDVRYLTAFLTLVRIALVFLVTFILLELITQYYTNVL